MNQLVFSADDSFVTDQVLQNIRHALKDFFILNVLIFWNKIGKQQKCMQNLARVFYTTQYLDITMELKLNTCAGCCSSLLFEYSINRCSQDMAH